MVHIKHTDFEKKMSLKPIWLREHHIFFFHLTRFDSVERIYYNSLLLFFSSFISYRSYFITNSGNVIGRSFLYYMRPLIQTHAYIYVCVTEYINIQLHSQPIVSQTQKKRIC